MLNADGSRSSVVIYVDVDDTLVRSFGSKRIPIPSVVQHIRYLKEQAAELYCWSSGGAEYARTTAQQLGIEDCCIAFLPKPQVMVDDQRVDEWRYLLTIHPGSCALLTSDDYRRMLQELRGI